MKMSLKSQVAASLFAIGALISANVIAANDQKVTEEPPAAAESKKKIKPHSHVEEKGGTVSRPSEQKESAGHKDAKIDPAKDKTKHYHPRDGK
jgi:hypothetical protein